MIEVSAGIIRRADGAILICQRGKEQHHAGLWEFPGGKREDGEDAATCLERELREELSLPVTDVKPLCVREEEGIRFSFLAARTEAEPTLTEHAAAMFVPARQLLKYAFCLADAPVARRFALTEPPLRHFFWDFDGTLMDTYPASVDAFVAGAAALGATVDREYAMNLMKDTLPRCIRTIAEENGFDVDTLTAAFCREEQKIDLSSVPPVPGIPAMLEKVSRRGGRHYLVTHRDRKALDYLRSAGLLDSFTDFITQESGFPRKPQPDSILHLMHLYGLNPAECIMVGDRPLDTEAGQNAGILACLLDPDDRYPNGPCDLRVKSIAELMDACC